MFATAFLLAAALTKIAGVVTLERPDLPYFYLLDDNGVGWHVATVSSTTAPVVGTRVVAEGHKERSSKQRLAAIKVTALENPPVPLNYHKVSVAELFSAVMPHGNSAWYARPVVCEAMVRDLLRREKFTQLLIGEGEHNVQVELPVSIEEPLPANLVLGAVVEVRGVLVWTSIENYDAKTFGRIENLEILVNEPTAVMVVKRAPYWTVERVRRASLALLALLLLSLGWVVTLRRMVIKRSRDLAESIRQNESSRIEADAVRRERLRLAADLHDGFQQYLAGAMFRLKAAMNYLPENAHDAREQLEKVRDALGHTQADLRSTLWAMNEESEGPESLSALFGFVSRRMAHWEDAVEIISLGEERPVARRIACSLLLILQESVGNAFRHGEAKSVKVTIDYRQDKLKLLVVDDGKGFEVAASDLRGHYGLAGMRRRTLEQNGEMTVESSPGQGTKLSFSFPL